MRYRSSSSTKMRCIGLLALFLLHFPLQVIAQGRFTPTFRESTQSDINIFANESSQPGNCTDLHPWCAGWGAYGECETNPSYMKANCPATCNSCASQGPNVIQPKERNDLSRASTSVPTHQERCVDLYHSCKGWGSRGECESNPAFMLMNCPATCNSCFPEDKNKCVNRGDDATCDLSAAFGLCLVNPSYNLRFCAGSCSKFIDVCRGNDRPNEDAKSCRKLQTLRNPDFECGVIPQYGQTALVQNEPHSKLVRTPRRFTGPEDEIPSLPGRKRNKKRRKNTRKRNGQRRKGNNDHRNYESQRLESDPSESTVTCDCTKLSPTTSVRVPHRTNPRECVCPPSTAATPVTPKNVLTEVQEINNSEYADLRVESREDVILEPTLEDSQNGDRIFNLTNLPFNLTNLPFNLTHAPLNFSLPFLNLTHAPLNLSTLPFINELLQLKPVADQNTVIADAWFPTLAIIALLPALFSIPFYIEFGALEASRQAPKPPTTSPPPSPPHPHPHPWPSTSTARHDAPETSVLVPYCELSDYLSLRGRVDRLIKRHTGRPLDPEVVRLLEAMNYCRYGFSVRPEENRPNKPFVEPPPTWPGISYPALFISSVHERTTNATNGGKRGSEFFCGGSLITPNHILTAAHCLITNRPSTIRLGDDLTHAGTNYRVKKTTLHPEYDPRFRYNDIAVIELEGEVRFPRLMRPYCLLPHKQELEGRIGHVSGWGYQPDESVSFLLDTKVTMTSPKDCHSFYEGDELFLHEYPRGIDDSFLCASNRGPSEDQCRGDSGGPLVTEGVNGRIRGVGVANSANGCSEPGQPSIYSRTSTFLSWIDQVVYGPCVEPLFTNAAQ
ncbi:uncharacterized protein [Macrobrachium rosenbergii]|uniref:uncharacterized protein n=1 Tax=Macrobrachium rosenbergii TaxID=79674 RepID=UPI0034D5BF92